MKNLGKSSRWHSQGIQKIFRAPIYGAHCAVIFAIAQLSCKYLRSRCEVVQNLPKILKFLGSQFFLGGGGVKIPTQFHKFWSLSNMYQNLVTVDQATSNIWRWKIFGPNCGVLGPTIFGSTPNFWPSFLLLACYVPNVAKRSIWDQCKKKYILRTDRPATDDRRPHIWKISNGHISARGHPIHFMFGSTLGFSGSADRMVLFPLWPNSIGMWGKQLREE